MKLRLTPQSVRLRLNQLEVVKFALEGKLVERIDFPGPARTALTYSLRVGNESESGSVRFEDGEFTVIVPQNQAKTWTNVATEIGLYYMLELEDGNSLRVAIEKDYQCIDGPPEEHDPAGYPNPPAKVGCKTEKR